MPSTFTGAGIELIADGEQSGTWGQTTNINWQMMEEMVTGIVSIALTASTYTLTTTDGVSSNGRHAIVIFTGTPGATCTVTVSPNDMQKIYYIVNNSDQEVIMSQGTGANVSLFAGQTKVLYCDGAGAGAAVVDLSSSSGGAGATGGGGDEVFFENEQTVSNSYTISTNKNAMTTGPITIATGKSVTIPTGSVWVIL